MYARKSHGEKLFREHALISLQIVQLLMVLINMLIIRHIYVLTCAPNQKKHGDKIQLGLVKMIVQLDSNIMIPMSV